MTFCLADYLKTTASNQQRNLKILYFINWRLSEKAIVNIKKK